MRSSTREVVWVAWNHELVLESCPEWEGDDEYFSTSVPFASDYAKKEPANSPVKVGEYVTTTPDQTMLSTEEEILQDYYNCD